MIDQNRKRGFGCGRLNDEGHDPDGEVRGSPTELFESGSEPFRHVAPGVLTDLGRFAFQDACSPCPDPSTTRAKQAIQTEAAPAESSARTHASLVAPLVKTSSTKITFRSATLLNAPVRATIAPRRATSRSSRPKPPRLGVRLRLNRASTASSPKPTFSNSRARSAAWLYPRCQSRQRCSGTGTSKGNSAPRSGMRTAINRASKGARAILPPCLKLKINCRDASL